MVNEIAVVLLYGLLGWKVAAIYLVTGLMIAIISGWVIGRFKLEHWIEDWVQALRAGEAVVIEEKLSWADRIDRGRDAVRDIVGKVWIYVIAGIGVGAAIHGYVPEAFMASIMGKDAWWSVPAAVVVGIPMYSNAAGIVPVVEALLGKGCRTWHRPGLYDECYRLVTAGNGHSPKGTQTKIDSCLYRGCRLRNFIHRFSVQSDYLNLFCLNIPPRRYEETHLQLTRISTRKMRNNMEIKVCGPGCASCEKAQKTVEAAVAAKGIQAVVVKVTDFQEIAQLGIFSTPAVVVDGQVKCVGRAPKQSEVEEWIG